MADDPILALKQQLASAIVALADPVSFFVAAQRLGIDPSRLSDLRRGRIARFSLERLIRILATVDREVSLTIVVRGDPEICWHPELRARKQARLARLRRERTVGLMPWEWYLEEPDELDPEDDDAVARSGHDA